MDKYIFLDIDGVIATPETIVHGTWDLTPGCQTNLGIILDATDAKIVMSSSWRHNTVEKTIEIMQEHGFLFCDKIVGVTIRAYKYLDVKVHLSIPRGVEIKQWLDTHARYPWIAYPERSEEYKIYNEDGSFKIMKSGRLGIDYNFLILDDDNDMLLEHQYNFVNTYSELGLTKDAAIQAIQILNKYD